MSIRTYFEGLRHSRVLVAGLGVSNRPVQRLLERYGVPYAVWDAKINGGAMPPGAFDLIFRTPGLRPDAEVLRPLLARGAELTSEMEVFAAHCPCTLIAVTGSDGKTTTSTLIAELLRAAGHTVFLGGNLGVPLLEQADEMPPDAFAVVELSSFQLITMRFAPDVAVLTNLTPNHLDWHRDMDEYRRAKENVFRHQRPGQVFIDSAPFREVELLVPGRHNVQNFLLAERAAAPYVTGEAVERVRRTFRGVAHRLEFVRELSGVRWYNDSIASSPARCIAGLRSFDAPVALIAGGSDKRLGFGELAQEIASRCRAVLLTGDTASAIRQAVEAVPRHPPAEVLPDLEAAVHAARRIAQPGDVALLSPACASFDRYHDFAERGEAFRRFVDCLT